MRHVRRILELRFRPGADTGLALLTAMLFTGLYYAGTHSRSPLVSFLLLTLLGTGVVCVILPAFYVLRVRREDLESLGITRRLWWLALPLSAFLGLGSLPALLGLAETRPGVPLLPHLIVNGLSLWEPFFVHGWLQLRFERAFGILPGILLAALCFGGYHLGTFPTPAILALVGFSLLYGALFRAVGANLFMLWPLIWAVGSGIGTLQGGFVFDWTSVPGAAVLLAVQVAAMALFARHTGQAV